MEYCKFRVKGQRVPLKERIDEAKNNAKVRFLNGVLRGMNVLISHQQEVIKEEYEKYEMLLEGRQMLINKINEDKI